MKTLDPLIVAFLGKQDDQHVICLAAKDMMIQRLGTYRYQLLAYLDLTNNHISDLSKFQEYFPSAWWIIFRRNQICTISTNDFGSAIGLLDLTHNSIALDTFIQEFQTKYILRLSLCDNRTFNSTFPPTRAKIIEGIRNLWVLDDDFISFAERKASLRAASPARSVHVSISEKRPEYLSGNWSPPTICERETILMSALQQFPQNSADLDLLKLEILLEDYLEESRVFNRCCCSTRDNDRKGNHPKVVISVTAIMRLPHKKRIDLSVMLTVMLLYDIPPKLLTDSLQIMLLDYLPLDEIGKLLHLPRFAKTALVCIIRQITKKERRELQLFKHMVVKPRDKIDLRNTEGLFAPTFTGTDGFNHLRAYKEFMSIDTKVGVHEMVDNPDEFSDLEIELLDSLPDVPTFSTKPAVGTTDFRNWVSFAARHAILILKKSPACPPLTRTLTQRLQQQMYDSLLPLLKAAAMTYKDLDIDLTGPEIDGREYLKDFDRPGKVLAFGEGLPKSVPNQLKWNSKSSSAEKALMLNTERSLELSVENDFMVPQDVYDAMRVTVEGVSFVSNSYASEDTGSTDSVEYEKRQRMPSRVRGLLSLEGPVIYNITESADFSEDMSRRKFTMSTDSKYEKSKEYACTKSVFIDNVPSVEENQDIIQQSKVLLSEINGFSADAAWKPSFVLAPSKLIQAQNSAHAVNEGGFSKEANTKQAWWKWDDIHHPPLLLHPELPTSTPLTTNSVNNWQSKSTSKIPKSISTFVQGDTFLNDPFDAAKATEQLMLEMGTIRNIRRMKDLRVQRSVVVDDMRTGKAKKTTLGKLGKSLVHDADRQNLEMQFPDGIYDIRIPERVSWSNFTEVPRVGDKTEQPSVGASNILQSNLFITATEDAKEALIEEDDETSLCQPKMLLSESNDLNLTNSAFVSAEAVSTSAILRDKLKYDKIFSATNLVEKDSNRRISSTWHPKYDKVVYMLDKSALAEVQLKLYNKHQPKRPLRKLGSSETSKFSAISRTSSPLKSANITSFVMPIIDKANESPFASKIGTPMQLLHEPVNTDINRLRLSNGNAVELRNDMIDLRNDITRDRGWSVSSNSRYSNSRGETARSDDYKQSYKHADLLLRIDASRISYTPQNYEDDSLPSSSVDILSLAPPTTESSIASDNVPDIRSSQNSHRSLSPPPFEFREHIDNSSIPISDDISVQSELSPTFGKQSSEQTMQVGNRVILAVPSGRPTLYFHTQDPNNVQNSILRPIRNSVPLNRSFRATVNKNKMYERLTALTTTST